ncbi:SRPBCC family protein [Bordetella genomosp. 13]|uniref:Carbon monoxide dehydrogenase n=1 Tax=Bordetella genomosp. 13 TaxID=463040 RepID=A0A1W6ZI87_9BORD|nr:carbon monoxide dehydrogenase subunit G [Bordetella genomosp. 13]ARP96987.1 carbon monoxide dehydrogenase [Bordetella genomosp. 13]
MRIADAQWIPSTPHQTWDALHDPAVLQQCLPGCIKVEQRTPTEYGLVIRTKVAGFEADYEGEILLSDVDEPRSCTLAFEGKGRAAGLAIGTAQVSLTPKEEGTRLSYTVAAMAGGKLAELGEATIMKAGGKIVDKFFGAFIEHMARQPRTAAPPPPPQPEERGLANSPWSWAVALAVVTIIVGYHALYR